MPILKRFRRTSKKLLRLLGIKIPLRIVLDTNVIVSGTMMSHGPSFQILEAWRKGTFDLLISQAILDEVNRVLHYPRIKVKRKLTEERIEGVLDRLNRHGIVISPGHRVRAINEDAEDNKFIEVAIEGEADCIVTGDGHILSLGKYKGIKILPPQEFIREVFGHTE